VSAPVARQWVYDALSALKTPREQMWLGAGFATLLVVLFGPGSLTSHTTSPGQGSYQKGGPVNVPQATGPHAVYPGNSPPVTNLNKPIEPARPFDSSTLPAAPPPLPEKEFAVISPKSSSPPATTTQDPMPLEPARPLDLNTLPKESPPPPKEEFAVISPKSSSPPATTTQDPMLLEPARPLDLNNLPAAPTPLPK